MSLLTKPVAEMTSEEALKAARIGRLQFDPCENSPETVKYYNSLPTKEQLLKEIELENQRETDNS
jgi:hypothetical protein